ncbi:hypothetical protein M8J77_002343 [Diaphorina citri]|nr:hypothetical protein M8J77_002343 [Diaphorina citri]
MPVSEFQAVILAAGKGSRYTELTSRKAKCLLPIGSKPMLWYPLQLLERNGFQEAFVIVNESTKSEVTIALENTGLNIVPNILSIPAGEDWGTAESLKHFSEYFKSDLVVVSCDLLTNIDLQKVLNLYRKHNASITTLMFPYVSPAALTVPGPKSKLKIERDVVGVDPVTNQLVLLASASDFEENLPFQLNLLKKHGRVKLFSKLLDSHLYVINHWIIDYLTNEQSISTIKGELLPHIISKQNSRKNCLSMQNLPDPVVNNENDIYQFAKEDELAVNIRNISLYNDNDNICDTYRNDTIRCYTYVASGNEFAVRANTLFEFYKINREILEKFPDLTKLSTDTNAISPYAEILSTQLDSKSCTVGEHSKIAEKTSIKSSIISSKCTIKNKTRISDSIIMNGVTIGENSAITNCIICNDAIVSDNCNIKDCIIGSNYVVPKDSSYSQQVLTDVDRLMEI